MTMGASVATNEGLCYHFLPSHQLPWLTLTRNRKKLFPGQIRTQQGVDTNIYSYVGFCVVAQLIFLYPYPLPSREAGFGRFYSQALITKRKKRSHSQTAPEKRRKYSNLSQKQRSPDDL